MDASLQWVAQTVEALSYNHNNGDSIPDCKKIIFLYLEILCCQFCLYQQRLSPSFKRLWVMLNYQRDVLIVGAKFMEEKEAYLYFVETIKRNLRRF
jgi:hypothetical protein